MKGTERIFLLVWRKAQKAFVFGNFDFYSKSLSNVNNSIQRNPKPSVRCYAQDLSPLSPPCYGMAVEQ